MRTLQRLNVGAFLCLLPLLPISLRLGYLQIVRHDAYSSQVDSSTARDILVTIPRGRIMDRRGTVLAQSLPVTSCFLDRVAFLRLPRGRERYLAPLADALGLRHGELEAKLSAQSRNVWLKRDLSPEEIRKVWDLKNPRRTAKKKGKKRLPPFIWVGMHTDERRYYPNGPLARSILGTVNAEGRGGSGLEYVFDGQLGERSIPVRLTLDGYGRPIVEERREEVPPPPDLRLTIDRTIQFFAEQALDSAIRRNRAKKGSILVQDPKTGEILAVAVWPRTVLRNHAVQDVYEPGSTFKLLTAVAVIESGVLRPKERIYCEQGKWAMTPEKTIRDHDKHEFLGLAEIIQHSSNIGSAKLGLRLGAGTFLRYCKLFNFGYKSGIPLPGESRGLLPEAPTMRDMKLANAAFGQGIAVTPVQLLGAYSAIANGGRLMEPRLVLAVGDKPGRGAVSVRRVARPGTVAEVQRMLELVVERGTGVSARIPGYRVAGKTGTAQKIDPETGLYSETDFIASFAGVLKIPYLPDLLG
ncbi:peptidoglycan D,D-transpeptidase FtsI family protein, partial [Elusimicrobiota bacterium]